MEKGNKENFLCKKKGHIKDRCWKLNGKPSSIGHGSFAMNLDGKAHCDVPVDKSKSLTLALEKL